MSMDLPILNLPPTDARVTVQKGKRLIFDPLRKKYVALTSEEWVRRHFTNYLITEKGYPSSLLANEVILVLNGMARRCDTVVYDRLLNPLMIIEYKAPEVKLEAKVFEQIGRYNMALHVNYLAVSNGMQHFCCRIDYEKRTFAFMEDFPDYSVIAERF